MIFRVRKKLTWDGITYEIGDAISIEEGHPRLEAIVELTHHVAYDSSLEEEGRANHIGATRCVCWSKVGS